MFLLPRQRVKDQIARDRAERAEKVREKTLNGSGYCSRVKKINYLGNAFRAGSRRGG